MKRVALLLAAALFLGGCAYHLGDARPSMMRGITTIAVPVSKNKTLEPNVEALLSDTVVKALQTDGTYKTDYASRADAILETTLSQVERHPARSIRGNVLAASEYELVTTVDFAVNERSTGKRLMSGQVNGRTSFFVSGDLQTSETQALPLAFENAATALVSRLGEGF